MCVYVCVCVCVCVRTMNVSGEYNSGNNEGKEKKKTSDGYSLITVPTTVMSAVI
jgi:hypothetical protein